MKQDDATIKIIYIFRSLEEEGAMLYADAR
jgi:hypothetical protein